MTLTPKLIALAAELAHDCPTLAEDCLPNREAVIARKIEEAVGDDLRDDREALDRVLEIACRGTDVTEFATVAEMQVAQLYKWWRGEERECEQLRAQLAAEKAQHERDNKSNQEWIDSLCKELCWVEDALGFKQDQHNADGSWKPAFECVKEKIRDFVSMAAELEDIKAQLAAATKLVKEYEDRHIMTATALNDASERADHEDRAMHLALTGHKPDGDYRGVANEVFRKLESLRAEKEALKSACDSLRAMLFDCRKWVSGYAMPSESNLKPIDDLLESTKNIPGRK